MKRYTVQRLFREFPYLWRLSSDWSHNTTVIKVRRIDRNALLQVIRSQKHQVFYHEIFSGEWWRECLWEQPIGGERTLVDVLNTANLTYRGRATGGRIVDVILVLEKLRYKDEESSYGRPANGAIYGEEDRITIYKPPVLHTSILPFLTEERERLGQDQERLSVLLPA